MAEESSPRKNTALIIGGNRGIGLQFVKTFIERGWDVVATARPQTKDDESFKELADTGVRVLDLDYLLEETITNAAHQYGTGPLDVLVNCAGTGVRPRPWEEHFNDDLIERFRVMAVGPFLATRHFLPNLLKSDNGRVINISSGLGSITTNVRGNHIGYRMAKSALNQQTVTLSVELKNQGHNVVFLVLSPGYVPTKLNNFTGTVKAEDSVNGMINIIEKATMEVTGKFFRYNGEETAY